MIIMNGEISTSGSSPRAGGKGSRFRARSRHGGSARRPDLVGSRCVAAFERNVCFRLVSAVAMAPLGAGPRGDQAALLVRPARAGLAFGSQFDCCSRRPGGSPGPVRRDVLHLYLRLHHIPAPYGLLENTHQLGVRADTGMAARRLGSGGPGGRCRATQPSAPATMAPSRNCRRLSPMPSASSHRRRAARRLPVGRRRLPARHRGGTSRRTRSEGIHDRKPGWRRTRSGRDALRPEAGRRFPATGFRRGGLDPRSGGPGGPARALRGLLDLPTMLCRASPGRSLPFR